MTALQDPDKLAQIIEVLTNTANGVVGYMTWKKIAWEWVAENLDSETQKSMANHLLSYVNSGGKIDQVVERRGYDDPFHYDFRPRINNLDVYVETVLRVDRMGPTLHVVSAHLK